MRNSLALVMLTALGFAPASSLARTLTFDELAHGTALSDEYAQFGVVLASTAPIGPGASSDPADHLQPGEAVAPYVFAINSVPSGATPSPPNKIIGGKYDAGGGLIQCERCGISIRFLEPAVDVSFWLVGPNAGQTAEFFGPHGSLGVLTSTHVNGAFPELFTFSDEEGISEIVLTSVPTAGIGFDSLTFSVPVLGSASPVLLAFGGLTMVAASRLSCGAWRRDV